MPKLTRIQWIIFALLLAFYGFAVFALTRDYYLRNPARAVAAVPSPHGLPPQPRTWIQDAMEDSDDSIPAALVESNPLLLHQKADELFARKRYGEAIRLYRRVIEIEPEDVDAHNDLGLALHYAGQSQAGLEVLEAGVAAAPEFQRIWLTLGFVRAQSGDEAGAREALGRARDLDPDNGLGQEATRILERLQSE